MGAKTRPLGFHNVSRCPSRFYSKCLVRDHKCNECVHIQGRPSEFITDPAMERAMEHSDLMCSALDNIINKEVEDDNKRST